MKILANPFDQLFDRVFESFGTGNKNKKKKEIGKFLHDLLKKESINF